jgi:hypothetical protein
VDRFACQHRLLNVSGVQALNPAVLALGGHRARASSGRAESALVLQLNGILLHGLRRSPTVKTKLVTKTEVGPQDLSRRLNLRVVARSAPAPRHWVSGSIPDSGRPYGRQTPGPPCLLSTGSGAVSAAARSPIVLDGRFDLGRNGSTCGGFGFRDSSRSPSQIAPKNMGRSTGDAAKPAGQPPLSASPIVYG